MADFEETDGLFPNSPPEPGSKQRAKQGGDETGVKRLADNAEMEEEYLANDVIDLPAPPSLRRYSPGRVEQMKIGEAGLHIANRLRESFQTGQDYRRDFDHYLGCLAALNLDAPTLTELRRLRKEMDKTNNIEKHETIFQDVRSTLLDLRPGRKG
ncbi:MAG: hypothetical protein ACLQGU_19715 [bacterium]